MNEKEVRKIVLEVIADLMWAHETRSTGVGMGGWTEDKNRRRCELIDLQIDGTISEDESKELIWLTEEFREYRLENFPLPIQGAKEAFERMRKNSE